MNVELSDKDIVAIRTAIKYWRGKCGGETACASVCADMDVVLEKLKP